MMDNQSHEKSPDELWSDFETSGSIKKYLAYRHSQLSEDQTEEY